MGKGILAMVVGMMVANVVMMAVSIGLDLAEGDGDAFDRFLWATAIFIVVCIVVIAILFNELRRQYKESKKEVSTKKEKKEKGGV